MPGFDGIGRMIILMGVILVVVGLIMTAAGSLNLGRLPGDLIWRRGNFTVYFPLATSIIISLILTLILNLIFRR